MPRRARYEPRVSVGAPSRSVDLGRVAALVVDGHGAAPCAVVAGQLGSVRGRGAHGRLARGAARAVEDRTPFDLASVTKPVVALTMARLFARGLLSLDEPLAAFLPWLDGTPSATVPLELFASHRAGLEAHIKLYAPQLEGGEVDLRRAARVAAGSRRADCGGSPPAEGFPPVYSDMGYLLVGLALETRAGLPLDALVQREVTGPLGLDDRMGSARQLRARDASFDARVAPTEDVDFRGGVVTGAVHDENAFALSGDALSGHAGLFGDAEAVLELALAVVGALDARSSWLGPEAVAPLVRPRPGGSLRMGFDSRTEQTPSSGARLGPRTFGHLGFTGTSVWIDPDAEFAGVLLTNRVHPTREHLAIRAARPAAYDAMFDDLSRAR